MGTRECNHICDESSPGVGEAGRTGEWRIFVPIMDNSKCIPARSNKPTCFLCWLYCPEAVMTKSIPVAIDLEYCKGCGICAQVCPVQAITMLYEEKSAAQV
jgi:pyruvate ferredoxin oxidoreductase delta subunit